jgi:hypothetical protein
VQFCPWYPLCDAAQQTPAAANILQVRVAVGLIDYPRGKSAMIHYQRAENAREAAIILAQRWPGRDLWCRHLLEIDDLSPARLAGYYATLSAEFLRRFGAAPSPDKPRSP